MYYEILRLCIINPLKFKLKIFVKSLKKNLKINALMHIVLKYAGFFLFKLSHKILIQYTCLPKRNLYFDALHFWIDCIFGTNILCLCNFSSPFYY